MRSPSHFSTYICEADSTGFTFAITRHKIPGRLRRFANLRTPLVTAKKNLILRVFSTTYFLAHNLANKQETLGPLLLSQSMCLVRIVVVSLCCAEQESDQSNEMSWRRAIQSRLRLKNETNARRRILYQQMTTATTATSATTATTPKRLLLESSCSTLPIRHLASLLLEFTFPGQRRQELLEEARASDRRQITGSLVWKKPNNCKMGPEKFLRRCFHEKRYLSVTFEQYVVAAREVDDNPDIPLPSATDFYKSGVSSELKISDFVFEWMSTYRGKHKGNSGVGCWVGGRMKTHATTKWVKADDVARQAVFFDPEQRLTVRKDPLAQMCVETLGKDYKLRRNSFLKGLDISKKSKRSKNSALTMSKEEQDYVDELLLSPQREGGRLLVHTP